MSYRDVKLDRVLARVVDEVRIEPLETYATAGIYSYGRGLFHRSPILGSETSYRSYFRLHEGDFVYSKLFAWEGAMTVVPPVFDGILVSSEFPTFEIDREQVNTDYFALVCRWRAFHERVAGGSTGLGVRRQRVNPGSLLALEVPLPSLDEQERLVGRLQVLRGANEKLSQRLKKGSTERVVSLYPGVVDRMLRRRASNGEAVGELADFVNDIVRPGESAGAAEAFVGLQHVESHTGRRVGHLPLGEEKGRKFRFQPGDVVYGYLRPYLNKVWVADIHGLCSVDQYVLRPKNGMSPAYLAHALRSRSTLDQAIVMTHSLQLPRLRSGLLSQIEIPVMEADQAELVTHELDDALATILKARDLRHRQEGLVKALADSMLNRAFAGLL